LRQISNRRIAFGAPVELKDRSAAAIAGRRVVEIFSPDLAITEVLGFAELEHRLLEHRIASM
jgi:hypothetical protein